MFNPRDRLYYKTLEDNAEKIFKLMSKQMNVNTFFITLTNLQESYFVKVFNRDYHLLKDGMVLPFQDVLCKLVSNNGQKPLIISKLSADPLTAEHIVTQEVGEGCFLAVPLVLTNGEEIGTLCAFDNKPYTFNESDVELITSLGNLLSQSIMLETLYIRDQLTGLYNRNFANQYFDFHEIKKSSIMGLIFMDIDRFKLVNDTYGHKLGDRLIQLISERISDEVGEFGTICRMGGDEFLIILPKLSKDTYNKVMQEIMTTIQASLTRSFEVENNEFLFNATFGSSIYPNDGDDMSTLLKKSDMAMYKAKEKGSIYEAYRSEHSNEIQKRLLLEVGLRKALEQNEFEMYYQPQYDMKKGNVLGLEALIRWNHPEYGIISPGEFIPIAEETGLIIPIGEWVIEEVCQQGTKWFSSSNEMVYFSVNISSEQFRSEQFSEKVVEIINKTGFNPKWLIFELTETILMNNITTGIQVINKLKDIGVCIAIDDFGTGYSSLSYLRHMPIDYLKIDRSFINEVAQHQHDQAIVKVILSLGQELDMMVIAEGIEVKEQHDYLLQKGCFLGQGFYYHRPVPIEELMGV